MKTYQLSRLRRGKGQVARADHERHEKLPSTAGIDGIRKKKIITMPCIVKSLL
jgi:hypothetical protein